MASRSVKPSGNFNAGALFYTQTSELQSRLGMQPDVSMTYASLTGKSRTDQSSTWHTRTDQTEKSFTDRSSSPRSRVNGVLPPLKKRRTDEGRPYIDSYRPNPPVFAADTYRPSEDSGRQIDRYTSIDRYVPEPRARPASSSSCGRAADVMSAQHRQTETPYNSIVTSDISNAETDSIIGPPPIRAPVSVATGDRNQARDEGTAAGSLNHSNTGDSSKTTKIDLSKAPKGPKFLQERLENGRDRFQKLGIDARNGAPTAEEKFTHHLCITLHRQEGSVLWQQHMIPHLDKLLGPTAGLGHLRKFIWSNFQCCVFFKGSDSAKELEYCQGLCEGQLLFNAYEMRTAAFIDGKKVDGVGTNVPGRQPTETPKLINLVTSSNQQCAKGDEYELSSRQPVSLPENGTKEDNFSVDERRSHTPVATRLAVLQKQHKPLTIAILQEAKADEGVALPSPFRAPSEISSVRSFSERLCAQCKRPPLGFDPFVTCSCCPRRYHDSCKGLMKKSTLEGGKWSCQHCTKKRHEKSLLIRKQAKSSTPNKASTLLSESLLSSKSVGKSSQPASPMISSPTKSGLANSMGVAQQFQALSITPGRNAFYRPDSVPDSEEHAASRPQLQGVKEPGPDRSDAFNDSLSDASMITESDDFSPSKLFTSTPRPILAQDTSKAHTVAGIQMRDAEALDLNRGAAQSNSVALSKQKCEVCKKKILATARICTKCERRGRGPNQPSPEGSAPSRAGPDDKAPQPLQPPPEANPSSSWMYSPHSWGVRKVTERPGSAKQRKDSRKYGLEIQESPESREEPFVQISRIPPSQLASTRPKPYFLGESKVDALISPHDPVGPGVHNTSRSTDKSRSSKAANKATMLSSDEDLSSDGGRSDSESQKIGILGDSGASQEVSSLRAQPDVRRSPDAKSGAAKSATKIGVDFVSSVEPGQSSPLSEAPTYLEPGSLFVVPEPNNETPKEPLISGERPISATTSFDGSISRVKPIPSAKLGTFSYKQLIVLALTQGDERKTASEIVAWIATHMPTYAEDRKKLVSGVAAQCSTHYRNELLSKQGGGPGAGNNTVYFMRPGQTLLTEAEIEELGQRLHSYRKIQNAVRTIGSSSTAEEGGETTSGGKAPRKRPIVPDDSDTQNRSPQAKVPKNTSQAARKSVPSRPSRITQVGPPSKSSSPYIGDNGASTESRKDSQHSNQRNGSAGSGSKPDWSNLWEDFYPEDDLESEHLPEDQKLLLDILRDPNLVKEEYNMMNLFDSHPDLDPDNEVIDYKAKMEEISKRPNRRQMLGMPIRNTVRRYHYHSGPREGTQEGSSQSATGSNPPSPGRRRRAIDFTELDSVLEPSIERFATFEKALKIPDFVVMGLDDRKENIVWRDGTTTVRHDGVLRVRGTPGRWYAPTGTPPPPV